MTIAEFVKKYPRIEIELLLSHILGKPKEFLYLYPEYKLSSSQVESLSSLIKRRQKGEPVAYILGYKDFYGLRFKVNKDVLIPRPETEWFIDRVIARSASDEAIRPLGRPERSEGSIYRLPRAKILEQKNFSARNDTKLKILDLGTGSGAIAISLAKQFSFNNFPASAKAPSFVKTLEDKSADRQFSITASDISKRALSIAKFNAVKQKVNIRFYQSDLFKKILGKFDIIIANLPYVPLKNYELRIKNLEWEPKLALTDGTNKFEIYRRFFEQVPSHLNKGGLIYFEIDPKAKPFVKRRAKKYLPGSRVNFFKDFNNFWRYAEIQN